MRPLLFYIQCIRGNYYSFLFKITKAPITPGTQPQQVSNKTINTEPQPLSITAKGGKIIANKTRRQDIYFCFLDRSLCKCSGVQGFRSLGGSGVTSEQARSASEPSERLNSHRRSS